MSDEKIIELYLKRDEAAISATAEKYGAYLMRIAYNILSDEFDSEECVNDTYMRTWNRIPPEIPRYLSAFLAKITRNLSLDRVRARNSERRGGGAVALSLDELAECVGGEESQVDSGEIARVINCFLSGLSELDRRMFVLRYFHEEGIAVIAERLQLGESNVKVRLHRLRAKLRVILEKEGLYY